MDTLQLLLLERPMAVYVALVFAEGIALVVLHARRTRRATIGAAVPVVLGVLVAILSALVTTQRERVAIALEDLCRAAVAGDGAGFAAGIDEGYQDGVYRKDRMVATVARLMPRKLFFWGTITASSRRRVYLATDPVREYWRRSNSND